MKCEVGQCYRTRFGRVRLRERDGEEVERLLLPLPEDVAGAPAAGRFARLELLEALRRWREEALKICRAKAGPEGGTGEARAGLIRVTSCYRPLGTTAGAGRYLDRCGCIDSTDDFGHWSGFAVDVPTRYFRRACSPPLTVAEINEAATRAGLARPFLSQGEWWHYRVRP